VSADGRCYNRAPCPLPLLLRAPGYSSIIKNPMDLSAMRAKVEGGGYVMWGMLMVCATYHSIHTIAAVCGI
jgi:hypothetical protein